MIKVTVNQAGKDLDISSVDVSEYPPFLTVYLRGDSSITLKHLQELNVKRALKWHIHAGLEEWSPLEWAGAMAGEVGEAANAAKKLKRVMYQIQNHDSREPLPEDKIAFYKHKIGKEAADAIIYGVLLAAAVGEDIEDCIREVFNTKSEEYGFPERL